MPESPTEGKRILYCSESNMPKNLSDNDKVRICAQNKPPDLESLVNSGVRNIIFDLDYTLLRSRGSHGELVELAFRKLLPNKSQEMRDYFRALPPMSYKEKIKQTLRAFSNEDENYSVPQILDNLEETAKKILQGQRSMKSKATLMPGALELVNRARALELCLFLCTASFRSISNVLLHTSGLSDYFNPEARFCADDSSYTKYENKYCLNVFGAKEPSSFIGVEDRVSAAIGLLKSGVYAVIICPSSDLEWESLLQVGNQRRLYIVKNLHSA